MSMSVPSKPQAVVKSNSEVTIPLVIIISDERQKIPGPFPFPATYSANLDIALHKSKKLFCVL